MVLLIKMNGCKHSEESKNMKSVIKKSVTIKDKKTEDLEQQIVDQEDRHKRRRLTLLRGKYQRGMKMLYNQLVEIEKL